MPTIQAFHGLRYDLAHVGSLSNVVAPPYDVIDEEMQEALYKQHPANVVRLILNRAEPGDDENSRYERAAKFLRNWQREGALQSEGQAAIYVYKQTFTEDGQEYSRSGFMCRTLLERFGEGKIYPHEETHSAAKADRLKLTTACKANLSQIFGLFPDPENEAMRLLDDAIEGMTPLEATDHLGVVHRLWSVTDVETISKLRAIMDPKPTFIADGHHRYETACNYRDQLGDLPPEHPANYVLMMCVGMSDPGMIVLPTHRMFRGVPELSSDELVAKLGDCFQTRIAGEGADLATPLWDEIVVEDDQGTIAFFCAKDERWVMAKVTDEEGNFRLYRSILPLGVPRLYFNGYNSSFFSQLNAEIAALWITEYMLGAIDLPDEDEMNRWIDERLAWMKARTDGKHSKGTNIIPFSVHQMDELLADIDLRLPLPIRTKQWFWPVYGSDFKGLTPRLLARHGIEHQVT